MRIALLSPLYESVPPRLYGGTERVVANLCRGLMELGHEVTLFASGDSRVLTELVSVVPQALRLSPTKINDPVAYHMAQFAAVLRRGDEFDVIHNHMDYLGFALDFCVDAPVVSTLHGRLDGTETIQILCRFHDVPLVSISDAQRRPVPDLNWVRTVHHGLPMDTFQFHPEPGKYLAFLGRISPEKRPDLAIDIAQASGVPLKIAAKVDAADRDYFKEVIEPRIDGRLVEYVGEITEVQKSDFLGNALGLLFPIDWPEPFGLAPVEAWATGTPVLARPCGSVPELHVDGLTGFVRESAAELAELVPELAHFDRAACRAYAEERFSLTRMSEDYVDVYRELIRNTTRNEREELQPFESDGVGRGLLHPVWSPARWDRQDHVERQ
jgi:glycosyltransferase involved in cell wall biosynthesis